MENLSDVIGAAKHLSQNQKSIIKSLSQFGVPVVISFFDSGEAVILNLQNRGLVEIKNGYVSLATLGTVLLQHWENQKNNSLRPSEISTKKEVNKQERIGKSNQFLELYKQGFSYQDIGDKYGLSRERVRQVLNPNVEFRVYLREREEAKLYAEEQAEKDKFIAEEHKKEQAKQKLNSKSLAALYPERVAELWDYEKNLDLKPEEVLAGSTQHSIWFKCSEEHSWNKKPNQIATSWRRSGTTGCPMCVGRKKKAERQPSLTDIYPEMIAQYWDYEKNIEISLDPEKLTLSSNKKVWFKCPHDGNEWQSSIVSTISQQWSR
jgi:Probable Zinc-ribbon domain